MADLVQVLNPRSNTWTVIDREKGIILSSNEPMPRDGVEIITNNTVKNRKGITNGTPQGQSILES